MRVATAFDVRRSRGGSSLIGKAAAVRLTGQNVRGLTTLKLEKLIQFMKEQRLQVTCLMETWRVTKEGLEIEEIDGFLIIHHGETAKSCNRGRNGVAIILNPEARAACELGGSMEWHGSNGRTLTVRIPLEGTKPSRCALHTHRPAVNPLRFGRRSTTKYRRILAARMRTISSRCSSTATPPWGSAHAATESRGAPRLSARGAILT